MATDGLGAVDIEDIALDGPFTVEAWIYLQPGEPIDNRDVLVSNSAAQPTQNLNFAFQRLRLHSPGSGTNDKIAAGTPEVPTVWRHYAITRDAAGALRLYRDGVLDASAVGFTLPFHVGYLGSSPAGGTVGASTLDLATKIHRALSVANVLMSKANDGGDEDDCSPSWEGMPLKRPAFNLRHIRHL